MNDVFIIGIRRMSADIFLQLSSKMVDFTAVIETGMSRTRRGKKIKGTTKKRKKISAILRNQEEN